MQELHRTLQRDLMGTDQQTLAAHTAQVRQSIARREATAVDDRIVRLGRRRPPPNTISTPACCTSASMNSSAAGAGMCASSGK